MKEQKAVSPKKEGETKKSKKEEKAEPMLWGSQKTESSLPLQEDGVPSKNGFEEVPLSEKMVAKNPEQIRHLLNRLRRIEGQVRGIHQMIEDDRYCIDVMDQILAARSALENLGFLLMEHHISHCLVHSIEKGHAQESVQEIMTLMRRFS